MEKIVMDHVVLYIHGQGGKSEKARHYTLFFKNWEVIGLNYQSITLWEAKVEFPMLFDAVCG